MENILRDINGVQICVGDKVAVVNLNNYGIPKHTLEQGRVVKINGSSISYRTEKQSQALEAFKKTPRYKKGRLYYYNTKLYTNKCVLILEGEFVPPKKQKEL